MNRSEIWVPDGSRRYDGRMCARCHQERPLAAYGPAQGTADGLGSWCLDCRRASSAAWRAQNPEKIAASNAARRLPTPAKQKCAECRTTFAPKRRGGAYCSDLCRKRALRARQREAAK